MAPDANTGGDSSTQPDDKEQESSTVEQTEEQAADLKEESTESTEQSEETVTEETEDAPSEESQEETDETVKPDEKKVEVTLDKPEDAKLPFHQEPRFQELIKEKNTYKEELAKTKPLAERARILDEYVSTNGINPQELTNALEYLRLRRQDPVKAFELLKQDYNALATYNGEILPPELQAEVTAGTLSPERAKQIVQANAREEHRKWMTTSQNQTAAQQHETSIQGAIDSWATTTMQRDPDLRKKASNEAVDGKWEYVDMKLRSLRQANPPKSPQEAVALTEKAYAEANKFFGSRTKPTVKRPLQSQTSNTRSSAVVRTEKDVIAAIMSGKRPHDLKYA